MNFVDKMERNNKLYKNLYDTLVHSAALFGKKTAVIDDDFSFTYEELLQRVDVLADYLKNTFELEEQSQVGFMMVNHIFFVTAFYAVAKINCIAVMVNTKYQSDEIKFILDDTDIKAFLCDGIWWEKAAPILGEHGIHKVIVDVKKEHGITFAEIWEQRRQIQTAYEPANGDLPVVMMHTSGTTGKPKGIMLSQNNILQAAYGYAQVQKCDNSFVTVLSVPMFHILGLSCVLTYFIYLGGTVVLSAFYRAEDVLEKITRYHATHFHSVPTVYIQLLDAYNPQKHDLKTLKIAVCGGAPVGEKEVEAFCKIAENASFRFAYGMTETAGSGTLSYEHRSPLKAVPNVEVVVAGENGELLEQGSSGEILFRGSVVAKGVWNQEAAFCGVVHSGDVGYLNEENEVTLLGRKKDIINRGGEKIFPYMIEEVFLQAKGVKEAAVFGIEDKLYGEVPAAVVVPVNQEKIDLNELFELGRVKLAKYKRPVLIEVWDKLPKTSNGKVKKEEIKRFFNEKRKDERIM